MRMIDADDAMERIKQAYEDMGVDTHGIWNKQLAEIFKTADVEDIRMCLHKILGAVAQAPTVDRPQGKWVRYMGDIWTCSACGENLMCDDIECNNYCPNCGCRMKGADDYERAIEQTEHDMLYEPTYNSEDGSM